MTSESDSTTRLLNFGVAKPSDLDESFTFLLTEEKEIKMLQPLDEQETIFWQEGKLNSSTNFKKKPVVDDKKRKTWNLEANGGFFDSKGNFITDRINNNSDGPPFNKTSNFTSNTYSDKKSSGIDRNGIPNHSYSHPYDGNTMKKNENNLKYQNSQYNGSQKSQFQKTDRHEKSGYKGFSNNREPQPNSRYANRGNFSQSIFSNPLFTDNKTPVKPKEETLWFLKTAIQTLGPLSTSELLIEMKKTNEQTKIKKMTDKYFVECKETNQQSLERNYLEKKQKVEQEKKHFEKQNDEKNIEQLEHLTVSKDNKNTNGQDTNTRLNMCHKTKRFLKRLNISLSLQEVYNIAKDKIKNDTINDLHKKTSVSKRDLTDLMDCFLEEVGIQVVLDVDKDGFAINTKKNKN